MTPLRITVVLIGFLLLSSLVLAAGPPEVDMLGVVAEVDYPGRTETHVILKYHGSNQEVCLGDRHFLKQHGFALKVGQQIEVTGKYKAKILVADSLCINGHLLMLQLRARYVPA
jgi:hypothetical protein